MEGTVVPGRDQEEGKEKDASVAKPPHRYLLSVAWTRPYKTVAYTDPLSLSPFSFPLSLFLDFLLSIAALFPRARARVIEMIRFTRTNTLISSPQHYFRAPSKSLLEKKKIKEEKRIAEY